MLAVLLAKFKLLSGNREEMKSHFNILTCLKEHKLNMAQQWKSCWFFAQSNRSSKLAASSNNNSKRKTNCKNRNKLYYTVQIIFVYDDVIINVC